MTAAHMSGTVAGIVWLEEGAPRSLATRLVAAGTHDVETAAQVERLVGVCAAQVERLGAERAADVLFGERPGPAEAARNRLALTTAAVTAGRPLPFRPTAGSSLRRRLEPLEIGAIRAVARRRPDRATPYALAEQGAVAAQLVALPASAFHASAGRIDVDVPAGERGRVDRIVTLHRWAVEPVTAHLERCASKQQDPCHRRPDGSVSVQAKAVAARIDRLLAATGVEATCCSVRLTTALGAFGEGGPVAAMRALGSNSVTATLRFLADHTT